MANNVAYGFANLQHLFSQHITTEMAPTIDIAVRQSFEAYQQQVEAMFDGLVERTTKWQINHWLAEAGEAQPLDEKGNPKPEKPVGKYEVAFPIKGWGYAYGLTEVARAHATMQDMNRFALAAMTKDLRRMLRHIFAAWFTNVTYTYEDEDHGALTIQPLANADGTLYTTVTGDTVDAQHFLAINSAIDDSNNPYETLYSLLRTYPSNDGPYVAYIPTNLVNATKALEGFREPDNVNIKFGANTDLANIIINPDMASRNSDIVGFGNDLIGYVDNVWIIESRRLPNDYVLGHARGAEAPFGMREYTPESLKGVRYSRFTPDGNEDAYRSKRNAGFGALNRVGACVIRMSAASYAIPAGYNAGTEVN